MDNEFEFTTDQVFNFEVGPLLPGTVCLFGGYYDLLSSRFRIYELTVPSESCSVPVLQSTGKF